MINMSYGWSVWYVPQAWEYLMKNYNFKHIPHITLVTNLDQKPKQILSYPKHLEYVTLLDDITVFPKMYINNPLNGIGWFCQCSPDIYTKHIPHITYSYFKDLPSTFDIPDDFPTIINDWILMIGNTQSPDPQEWKCVQFLIKTILIY